MKCRATFLCGRLQPASGFSRPAANAKRYAAAFTLLVAGLAAQIRTGPDPGATIPKFELQDQNGKLQNFQSIAGPKGALIVFYRSADW